MRHGLEPRWRALQGVQLTVRPIDVEGPALGVVDGDSIGHGVQDGTQVLGPLGRLGLAGLRPLSGVLLSGVEAGAVDRQGNAVAGALQQLHVGLGEATRRSTAHAEHSHQPAHQVVPFLVYYQERHTGDRAQPLPKDRVHPLEVSV